jgi:GxxExxY protein
MLTNPGGLNDLTSSIIDAAITVHKETGPGLLEAVYTECLLYELQDRGLYVETHVRLPLVYRGHALNNYYTLDMRVEKKVILEIKSAAALLELHRCQLLTYLKLGDSQVGLLINFNVPVLKDGLKRVVRPGLDGGQSGRSGETATGAAR